MLGALTAAGSWVSWLLLVGVALFLWQPLPSLVGSRELDLRFLCPGKGQECFHRPAHVLRLGNCCWKFPLTAGPNLRQRCAPVYFPEILNGISESSRPAKPLCSLSHFQVFLAALHCVHGFSSAQVSIPTQGVIFKSRHTHPSKLQFHQRICF